MYNSPNCRQDRRLLFTSLSGPGGRQGGGKEGSGGQGVSLKPRAALRTPRAPSEPRHSPQREKVAHTGPWAGLSRPRQAAGVGAMPRASWGWILKSHVASTWCSLSRFFPWELATTSRGAPSHVGRLWAGCLDRQSQWRSQQPASIKPQAWECTRAPQVFSIRPQVRWSCDLSSFRPAGPRSTMNVFSIPPHFGKVCYTDIVTCTISKKAKTKMVALNPIYK